jgi:glucose-1-phosphate cytidylyltransferase
VGAHPILWHIMKLYSHHGVNDFIVCLGYKGYLIKEYFANYCLHNSDVTFDMRSGECKVHQNNSEDWRVTLVDTGEQTDLTDILYHRHRETIALPPPDPEVVGQG